MSNKLTGIHHITAIVGYPQENIDFYTEVLGLRLIKKTVNFDDPYTYHFYYGDKEGKPGTAITFFPHTNGRKGILGGGQVSTTSYAVPTGSIDFWEERLKKFNIIYVKGEKFGEEYVQFEDPHGLQLELVFTDSGEESKWEFNGIASHSAIKGFAGATLWSLFPEKTKDIMENVLKFEKVDERLDVIRYKSTASIGNIIDLKTTPMGLGKMGIGTVHHIALRVKDENELIEWSNMLKERGFIVSPVRDRKYFKSIYFREKGGNLFEIATDGPGFTVDEPVGELGKNLKLPSQYESIRDEIEKKLPPINVKEF
ncbi:ring-cleaving dioxygenase [Tepidimicrobium xylanilyticum]